MNVLLAFSITLALLLVAMIRFKVSPIIGVFCATVLLAFLTGVGIADLLELISGGFGSMMTSLGLVIAFGGIFGTLLTQSGATEEMAKGILRRVGLKNDLLALNLAGFVVSIPVYFGTGYIMLSPLANSLQKITNKRTASYSVSLFVGLLLTHCIVAPTPGPVAVAAQLGINLGWFILYGLIVALPASLVGGWLFGNILDKSKKEPTQQREAARELLRDKDLIAADPTKPSAALSIGLILFPILLIIIGAIVPMALPAGNLFTQIFTFLGNNNIALFIGMITAMIALKQYLVPAQGENIFRVFDTATGSIGNILLLLGVGGGFAGVISVSGLGEALVAVLSALNLPIILLAFLLALILRAALGSATIAMLTAVSVFGPIAAGMGYSNTIIGLAICAGTVGLTLPTDGSFWLPKMFNDLSVKESFSTITTGTTLASLLALAVILILNLFAGVLPGMF